MDFGREDYNKYFQGVESPIGKDEPVFMLRGLDPDTPAVMMEYCSRLMLQGSFEVAQSVFDHVKTIIQYQNTVGTKHPDLVRISEDIIQAQADIVEAIAELEVTNFMSKSEYEQLLSNMQKVYGPDSLLTILPSDYIDDTVPGLEGLSPGVRLKVQNARLVIRPTTMGWKILKNSL